MGHLARQRGRHARGGGSTEKGKDIMKIRLVEGGNVAEMVFGPRACAGGEAGTWNTS